MIDRIEHKILSNLIYNEDYMRKVIPFIQDSYFDVFSERIVFDEINSYITTYGTLPTKSVLSIEIENRKDISEDIFKECIEVLNIFREEKLEQEWLIDTTEKWCKERAVYLALMESVKIADGNDKTKSRDAIPSILSEALSISFDDHVGHDYFGDADARYEFYHRKEDKIEFDLQMFNKIIKEYPTASAHSGHFKSLLNELGLKKGFAPDIIFIDYLNICSSSRFKGGLVNSYTFIKAIAEEIRGLAVEYNVPIVSATQTTRSGYGSSDVEITDTSESFGLPATADLMFALISTEELEEMNQIMVKQLKNRYNDNNSNKRFVVGIDRSKMKLYDVEDSAQQNIVNSGQEDDYTDLLDKKFRSFDGFKV